jgi:caa(3)-type oxidase subunit IV
MSHYVTIWIGILVLFIISITIAQLSDNRPLVLVTAFGIATAQAFLVAAYFMHLKSEQPYIWYIMLSMILALALLYAGTQVDVGEPSGRFWNAVDTIQIIDQHAGEAAEQGHEQAQFAEGHGGL